VKIISLAVLSVLGIFFYSVAWTFTFSLLNAADNLLLFIGILLAAFLLGIGIWFVAWVVNKVIHLNKE